MSDKHVLWVEKYRPLIFDDYIFHDESHRTAFEQMVNDKTIPHLLLSGTAGVGKSSLARLLIAQMNVDPVDIKIINASDENSVDTIRDKIRDFVNTFPIGDFKVVLLEEADFISFAGQGVMRNLMEGELAQNARFVLTCNYENKIEPAIKSRCQHFRFLAPNEQDIIELVAKILINEKIRFDIPVLDSYITVGYPDIRKIINMLQQHSVNNELLTLTSTQSDNDYKFKLLELMKQDQWSNIRQLLVDKVSVNQWPDVYRFLYKNLNESPKFQKESNWEEGQVAIAEHYARNGLFSGDPEINFTACVIQLKQIGED